MAQIPTASRSAAPAPLRSRVRTRLPATAGLIAVVSLGGALPAGAGRRAAHPGPPLWLEIDIGTQQLRYTVAGELEVFDTWYDLGAARGEPLDAELEGRVAEAARAQFAELNPLAIDGTPRALELESVESHLSGMGIVNVSIEFRVEYESRPRRVDVLWETFEGTEFLGEREVPLLVKSGGDVITGILSPTEPEFIWHSLGSRPRRAPSALTSPDTALLILPLASLTALLGAALLVLLLRRAGRPESWVWGSVAGGLLLAFLLRGTLTLSVPAPWQAGPRAPDEARALAMFEELHTNIYRAFDAASEDEIYDLLAVSVEPAILDELYGEVYESLILRLQGGAVCRVDAIEVIERDVDLDPEGGRPLEFAVDWAWRVKGVVTHWGHAHRRMNRYRASYRVRHDGLSWKIAEVEILEHERVDDEG